jgi:transketolase
MRDAFIRAISEKATEHPEIFLMVGDIGYGVVENFRENFPSQFLNAGVAEQNMTGMAAGLASKGRKVFTYSIANFPVFRCLEQIRNDVAYNNLPVTVVSVGAGLSYGTLGYSHHALEDIAAMRIFPNMRVFSPADSAEVDACVDEIIREPRPTYLRLGKNGEPKVHRNRVTSVIEPLELAAGNSILVLATGSIANEAARAVEMLNTALGPIFSLFSVPQVKPLHLHNISLNTYSAVVTIEEHSVVGGFGSAVLESLAETRVLIPTFVFGVKDQQSYLVGAADFLRERQGLDVESLTRRLSDVLTIVRSASQA